MKPSEQDIDNKTSFTNITKSLIKMKKIFQLETNTRKVPYTNTVEADGDGNEDVYAYSFIMKGRSSQNGFASERAIQIFKNICDYVKTNDSKVVLDYQEELGKNGMIPYTPTLSSVMK